MSLWRTILKKEIYCKTSRIRNHRKSFFLILFSLLLYWGLYLGPNIFDIILPSLLKTHSKLYKPLIIDLIEYFFTIIFLTYFVYPFYILFRKKEIGYNEILLSSPVKPGDIFLGEFLSLLPFYFIGILIIGPLFISLIMQIMVLNVYHILIIYSSIFGLSFLGLLMGCTIANLIEYKMLKKRNSNSFNYISLLILSAIVATIFYFFHFAFDYMIHHPEFKNILIFYPSFWYSNLILYIIDPSIQEYYILNFWYSLLLALLIPIVVLYISYKLANKYYIFVENSRIKISTINKEHLFYGIIRKLTFSKINVLVVNQFKVFLRKKENIVKLFYTIGLTVVMGIIMSISLNDLSSELGIEFAYIKEIIISILSWICGIIFGILIGTNIFLGSKEILYLYKRTPRGMFAFVFSYLYLMLYLIIFLGLIFTVIFTILFQLQFFYSILIFLFFLLNSISFLLQTIGIQCYHPLFEESGKDMFLNIYIVIFLQVVSIVISLYLIIPNLSYSRDPTYALLNILIINLDITFIIALFLLYIGFRKLKKNKK